MLWLAAALGAVVYVLLTAWAVRWGVSPLVDLLRRREILELEDEDV